MEYRREIDGLRALAVVPVIFFHAGFETFKGGFVGVDIFFVISGYLITTIIIKELEQEKFSILGFYERRARRILPALFLVLFCSLPFAWHMLLPSDLKNFSQSLVAVTAFASNILFYQETGYFDTAAEFKPLLHTWSLAVEEQFYLLFPILLILLWRIRRTSIPIFVGMLAVLSLSYAQWATPRDPAGAFYLLPTRAWELLLGGLAAFYLSKPDRPQPRKTIGEAAGWLGVALIAFATLSYTKSTPFPGFYALVPTVGALLIILFATQQTTIGGLIGNKVFVWIGLISYSAYLWHQPLFAFARHGTLEEPSALVFTGLSALTLVLAYLSWRFIEAPFRSRTLVGRMQILLLFLVGSSFFLAIGLTGHLYIEQIASYQNRNNPDLSRSYEILKTARSTSPVFIDANRFDDGSCKFSVLNLTAAVASRLKQCHEKHGPGILIFGDSHATNLFHSIIRNKANAETRFVVGVTKNGCRLPTEDPKCQYNEILNFLQQNSLVFSHSVFEKAGFSMLDFGMDREKFRNTQKPTNVSVNEQEINGVSDYLSLISQYSSVTWFGPRTEPLVGLREYLKSSCRAKFTQTDAQKAAFTNLDETLNKYSKGKKWRYVSQMSLTNFSFPEDFGDCNRLLWMDMSHFSKDGEEVFGNRFRLADLLK